MTNKECASQGKKGMPSVFRLAWLLDMNKIKVMSVFGTRPDAIKMCPLVKMLEKNERIESIVCLTAQHRQMLDQVISIFGVHPDFDLNVMRDRQTLYTVTTGVLEGLERVLTECKPDLVLVHGDTTTSFVSALAAFYAKIPVGHVEAGLRTHDRYSPFPEEMNRTLTARLATLHFAPTQLSRENLRREGVTDNVYVTGNTEIDAMRYTVYQGHRFTDATLRGLDLTKGRYVLMTAHRRENLGEGLENICRAVLRLIREYPDLNIVYPVHLNPAVRETVFSMLSGNERIILLDPTDVLDTHNLLSKCVFAMTDSGGIQEDATALGIPALVLRTETERPEGVETGILKLVGVREDDVYAAAKQLLDDPQAYARMAKAENPYGDGHASEKIVEAILGYFHKA